MAGARPKTPVADVCDLLTVIAMDVPGEQLQKWRTGMDQATATATAQRMPPVTDRERARDVRAGWGLAPDQVAATERFHATFGARP